MLWIYFMVKNSTQDISSTVLDHSQSLCICAPITAFLCKNSIQPWPLVDVTATIKVVFQTASCELRCSMTQIAFVWLGPPVCEEDMWNERGTAAWWPCLKKYCSLWFCGYQFLPGRPYYCPLVHQPTYPSRCSLSSPNRSLLKLAATENKAKWIVTYL